jgi:hypothetical protein
MVRFCYVTRFIFAFGVVLRKKGLYTLASYIQYPIMTKEKEMSGDERLGAWNGGTNDQRR